MARCRRLWYAKGGLFVAWLALLAGEVALAGSDADAPQPKVLLEAVDIGKTDLNEKQTKVLERIKKSAATVDWQLTRLNSEALEAADASIVMSLTKDKKLELRGQRITTEGKKRMRLDWHGEKLTEAAHLSISSKLATGLIYTGDKVYAVEPIGNGLQAVVQLDQRKFKEDHPESFKGIERRKVKELKKAKDTNPVKFTVLVAYTPKVDDLQADVGSLINSAVDLANVSYKNSKINLRLELVDTVKVNYTESGTHEVDLERFRKKDDGFMDEIHKLRDDHKADVCVLLIDNDQYCGLAAAILASEDTAFVVVHHDCAVKNLSFPHEIGHLQGARHNLEVDPTVDPSYPYNHGYLSTIGNWRTIMAYPTEAQPNRIPFWSNPAIDFMGEAMGMKDKQNNARMLSESALTVSGFRK